MAYLELDGVIPLTREELTGEELTPVERRGQQRAKKNKVRGGKGRRYRIVGREVKNAVLYDGKDCAVQSPGRGCILHKTYVSHLGGLARLRRAAVGRDAPHALRPGPPAGHSQ